MIALVVVLGGVVMGAVAFGGNGADGASADLNETDTGLDSEATERQTVPGTTDRPSAASTSARGTVVDTIEVSEDGTVVVTYSTGANETRTFDVEDVDPAMVDPAGNWAYLPNAALPDRLRQAAGNHTAGVAVIGRWALVGDLSVAETADGHARVTVVAPAGMDVDPGRKAGFLARYLASYSLQPGSDDAVTLYIAPDTMPDDGRMYDDTGYITQHAFWDGDVASVWIHEYVHAQQAFTLEPEMQWFRQASATYLSSRIMQEQYGKVTDADVRARLSANPTSEETALANHSAWNGSRAPYYRGTKLLYAVDAAVRAGSDGEHTIVDVLRTMNERQHPVSVTAFVRFVERYTSEDEEWLRQAITEPGDLDDRVENTSSAFEGS